VAIYVETASDTRASNNKRQNTEKEGGSTRRQEMGGRARDQISSIQIRYTRIGSLNICCCCPASPRHDYSTVLLTNVVLVELVKGARSSLSLNKLYGCLGRAALRDPLVDLLNEGSTSREPPPYLPFPSPVLSSILLQGLYSWLSPYTLLLGPPQVSYCMHCRQSKRRWLCW
jgi:hypothetical protein